MHRISFFFFQFYFLPLPPIVSSLMLAAGEGSGGRSSELIPPLGLHLQGQAPFTLPLLVVVTFGSYKERRPALLVTYILPQHCPPPSPPWPSHT